MNAAQPPPAEPVMSGDPEAVLRVLADGDAYFWDVAEKLGWPAQRMLAAERVLVRQRLVIERPGNDRGAFLVLLERLPERKRRLIAPPPTTSE